MIRINSYSPGDVFASSGANDWQDKTLGFAQLPGAMVGLPYVYCANGVDIVVGGITGLTTTASANHNLSAGETTLPTSGLANNERYYVYGHDNAGTLEFITYDHSTAPPSANLVFRNAGTGTDTQYRYLFSYVTNSSGVILPFRKVGREVVYERSASVVVSNDFAVNMSGGNATSFANVSLAPWMPPHSRIALVEAVLTSDASGAFGEFASVKTKGDSGSFFHDLYLNAVQGVFTRDYRIVTSSDQGLSYKVTSSHDTLQLYVCGYLE